jgi:hypothetical protein
MFNESFKLKGGELFMTKNFRAILMIAVVVIAGITVASTALAKGNSGDTKPGWGYGDKNHVHTGPPGQSVHPGNNNDQGENEDNQGSNNQGKNKNK